jgi:hypothetical protein
MLGSGPLADAWRAERLFWRRAAALAEAGEIAPLAYGHGQSWNQLKWLEDRNYGN